jgi:AAA domain-containing protein/TIR domain-containing protein
MGIGDMAKIFISYKRNIVPDTPVATAVYEALRQEHDVFIDTTIQVGEKWAERIQKAIKDSDYIISFLSEHSINSEMVVAEIETAHHHGKAYGKPVILPVRLNFSQPLVYPLSAYLNPLQWALWDKDSDTPKLIAELKQAVSGGHLLADNAAAVTTPAKEGEEEIPTAFANIPRDLGSPEGTMPHQSPFYIERETDVEAMNALHEIQGVTITIKGPRQMGKSSLLNRLQADGKEKGMRTAFIDFQLIENASMENANIFYQQFCSLLSWEFEVEDRTEEYWKNPLGHVQKTTNYLQRHLLKEIKDVQILLAMDEVERMFGSPFRSDFFSMLRSWHNNRARGGDWTRLNIALVTSTEPYQFIADLNQSPFNVGQVVELKDFTLGQVSTLNYRHHGLLADPQVQQLYDLLGGHPYLTRKALYLVASQRDTFAEMLENACEDNGPFGDHLRNYLFRMGGEEKLKTGLIQVIKSQRCQDEHIFFQLRGAGLVKRVGDKVIPRNQLYADYFGKRLNG